jgi:hypothetical protein
MKNLRVKEFSYETFRQKYNLQQIIPIEAYCDDRKTRFFNKYTKEMTIDSELVDFNTVTFITEERTSITDTVIELNLEYKVEQYDSMCLLLVREELINIK